MKKISPARLVSAVVVLIISAAAPPLLLVTVPYAIYTIVSFVKTMRQGARNRDAYLDHAHTMRIGRFFADGGAK